MTTIEKPPNIIWKSDFNSVNIQLTEPFIESSQWWQDVIGIQPLPGLQYTGSDPNGDFGFQLQVDDTEPDPDIFIRQHLTNVLGPYNDRTRCLAQLVFANGSALDQSRSNWFFAPHPQYDDELYESWWMYIQPNVLDILDPSGTAFPFYNFRQIWECKWGQPVGNFDFRMNVSMIYQSSLGGFNWQVRSEDYVQPGVGEFEINSPGISEFGRWIFCEVWVKQHPTNGKIIVNVDNRTLCDLSGVKTIRALPAFHWKLAVIYTAMDRLKGYHWQLVDDITLRAN